MLFLSGLVLELNYPIVANYKGFILKRLKSQPIALEIKSVPAIVSPVIKEKSGIKALIPIPSKIPPKKPITIKIKISFLY